MSNILKQKVKTPKGIITFNLIKIDKGTFLMGSNKIKVTVPAFYMAETLVTQELWEAITGENPSFFKGKNRPVERVSWDDINGIDKGKEIAFLRKLNKITGRSYRLPSESEWEYAAIGGHLAKRNSDKFHIAEYNYAGSNRLEGVGWFRENTNMESKDVKQKMPNRLGIYDMSGNVEEWCEDAWHGDWGKKIPDDIPIDGSPFEDANGSMRIHRGGTWIYGLRFCHVSFRGAWSSDYRHHFRGFRLLST